MALPKRTKARRGSSEPGLLVVDSSLRPLYSNPEAVQILVYPNKPRKLKSFNGTSSEKIRSALLLRLPKTLSKPQSPFVTEFASGRRRYNCKIIPLTDSFKTATESTRALLFERAHQSVADFSLLMDVVRKFQSESAEYQRQLVQSEKLAGIGIMAAGIAHEVSNPLSVVLGKAEMILEEDDQATMKKYSEDIVKYTTRASDIIQRVTFYSRAAWAPGSQENQIDLNDLLNETTKTSKLSVHFDNVEILTDFHDVPPVNGNVGEFQQVFANIMKNAAQAMNGRGRLYLKTRHEDGYSSVYIKDTGPGITKGNLSKLFTPFFTTKDPGKGTGLGLNIVHKIVSNHGGNIKVESEEGKGATFIIRFPKAQESGQKG